MTADEADTRDGEWEMVPSSTAGFDTTLETRLFAGSESGLFRDLHAVLVSRGGGLVPDGGLASGNGPPALATAANGSG